MQKGRVRRGRRSRLRPPRSRTGPGAIRRRIETVDGWLFNIGGACSASRRRKSAICHESDGRVCVERRRCLRSRPWSKRRTAGRRRECVGGDRGGRSRGSGDHRLKRSRRIVVQFILQPERYLLVRRVEVRSQCSKRSARTRFGDEPCHTSGRLRPAATVVRSRPAEFGKRFGLELCVLRLIDE